MKNGVPSTSSKISAINQLRAAEPFLASEKPAYPLLIIGAKNDRFVGYRCSLDLHQAWHSDDSAGHDLPLDASPYTQV